MRFLWLGLMMISLTGCGMTFGAGLPQQIVLEAQPAAGATFSPGDQAAFVQIFEQRLNNLDQSEARVEVSGERQFIISLPDTADVDAISTALSARGLLEFIDPQGTYLAEGSQVCTSLSNPEVEGFTCEISYPTIVDSSGLNTASIEVTQDQRDLPAVYFAFDEPAATTLEQFTDDHIGRPISIVLDKHVVASPVIQGALPGEGIITFPIDDSPATAQRVAAQLRSGMLPTPVEVISVTKK